MDQVPVYIAEIAPKNLRGGLATTNQVRFFFTIFYFLTNKYHLIGLVLIIIVLQLMIVIGSSMSFLVGSVINWRELALAGKLVYNN